MIDLQPFLIKCNTSKELPTVILSWAQTIDGFLSHQKGIQSSISSSESLKMTHTIRSVCDGIMVGINTIISDDPILTCRLEGDHQSPTPIILDSKLRIPINSRILQRSPIICTTKDADLKVKESLEKDGIRVVVLEQDSKGLIHLPSLLPLLKSKYGISTLMVEGGSQVLRGFLSHKLGHLIILTIAPKFFGNGVSLACTSSNGALIPFLLDSVIYRQSGPDMVVIGFPMFT